jgi:hypothetical protein
MFSGMLVIENILFFPGYPGYILTFLAGGACVALIFFALKKRKQ